MLDDVIRYAERFNLCFIALRQLHTYRIGTVTPRFVRHPRQVRVGKQVYIHRIAFDSLFQPFRHAMERVLKPYFRYNQFGVIEDHSLSNPGGSLASFF